MIILFSVHKYADSSISTDQSLRLIDSAVLGKYPGLIDSAWIYCPICCTLVSGSLHNHDIATGRLHNDIIFWVPWVKVLSEDLFLWCFMCFHPVECSAFYIYRSVFCLRIFNVYAGLSCP